MYQVKFLGRQGQTGTTRSLMRAFVSGASEPLCVEYLLKMARILERLLRDLIIGTQGLVCRNDEPSTPLATGSSSITFTNRAKIQRKRESFTSAHGAKISLTTLLSPPPASKHPRPVNTPEKKRTSPPPSPMRLVYACPPPPLLRSDPGVLASLVRHSSSLLQET